MRMSMVAISLFNVLSIQLLMMISGPFQKVHVELATFQCVANTSQAGLVKSV